MIAYALVPREEPRRFVRVSPDRASWMFEHRPRATLDFDQPTAGWVFERTEQVRTDRHLFAGHGHELAFFYADEDAGRAFDALCDLECALFFVRWLRAFTVRP